MATQEQDPAIDAEIKEIMESPASVLDAVLRDEKTIEIVGHALAMCARGVEDYSEALAICSMVGEVVYSAACKEAKATLIRMGEGNNV